MTVVVIVVTLDKLLISFLEFIWRECVCIGHSYVPTDIMKTVVVPIVSVQLSTQNNYRPISLVTIMSKVLDGLLNTQLDNYIRIHDNQLGFKSGLSNETAIL